MFKVRIRRGGHVPSEIGVDDAQFGLSDPEVSGYLHMDASDVMY
jgi:hypothetical protein